MTNRENAGALGACLTGSGSGGQRAALHEVEASTPTTTLPNCQFAPTWPPTIGPSDLNSGRVSWSGDGSRIAVSEEQLPGGRRCGW